MTDAPVRYELQDQLAIVTLDDGKANAISHEVANGLHDALERAEKEAAAVVLTGRPGRFSAGFDLATMTSGNDNARELLRAGAEVAIQINGLTKPVVVACTGHALAMGAILLMAADVRIGAEGAFKIGLNEVAIGIPMPKFVVELGRGCLAPTEYTAAVSLATLYDPEGAVRAGFLDSVVSAEDLLDTAVATATELVGRLHPGAFAATRQSLRGEQIERAQRALADDVANFAIDIPS
ncbi:MAG TPA: crotonase/enoyl-CoA hydratase family protein [Acidimicrobiales bacterium]